MQDPADGRFLVRHKPGDAGLFTLSYCFGGQILHEPVFLPSPKHSYQIFFKNSDWLVACSPLKAHKFLNDLLLYHASEKGGLQCRLSRPCLRIRGQGITTSSFLDPAPTAPVRDTVRAESVV